MEETCKTPRNIASSVPRRIFETPGPKLPGPLCVCPGSPVPPSTPVRPSSPVPPSSPATPEDSCHPIHPGTKVTRHTGENKKTYTKCRNVRAMSMMQMCDTVVRSWAKITPEIIKKSSIVCGQVPDPKASEITSFKEGKICYGGLARLEHLIGMDIHKS